LFLLSAKVKKTAAAGAEPPPNPGRKYQLCFSRIFFSRIFFSRIFSAGIFQTEPSEKPRAAEQFSAG
jgi:hypothetical protein